MPQVFEPQKRSKYSDRTPGWGTGHFKAFFSKTSRTITVEILGINKQYEDETVKIFLKDLSDSFSFIIDENRRFCHLRKNLSDRFE